MDFDYPPAKGNVFLYKGDARDLYFQSDESVDLICTLIWMINRYVLYVFIVALAIDRLIVKHHEYI